MEDLDLLAGLGDLEVDTGAEDKGDEKDLLGGDHDYNHYDETEGGGSIDSKSPVTKVSRRDSYVVERSVTLNDENNAQARVDAAKARELKSQFAEVRRKQLDAEFNLRQNFEDDGDQDQDEEDTNDSWFNRHHGWKDVYRDAVAALVWHYLGGMEADGEDDSEDEGGQFAPDEKKNNQLESSSDVIYFLSMDDLLNSSGPLSREFRNQLNLLEDAFDQENSGNLRAITVLKQLVNTNRAINYSDIATIIDAGVNHYQVQVNQVNDHYFYHLEAFRNCQHYLKWFEEATDGITSRVIDLTTAKSAVLNPIEIPETLIETSKFACCTCQSYEHFDLELLTHRANQFNLSSMFTEQSNARKFQKYGKLTYFSRLQNEAERRQAVAQLIDLESVDNLKEWDRKLATFKIINQGDSSDSLDFDDDDSRGVHSDEKKEPGEKEQRKEKKLNRHDQFVLLLGTLYQHWSINKDGEVPAIYINKRVPQDKQIPLKLGIDPKWQALIDSFAKAYLFPAAWDINEDLPGIIWPLIKQLQICVMNPSQTEEYFKETYFTLKDLRNLERSSPHIWTQSEINEFRQYCHDIIEWGLMMLESFYRSISREDESLYWMFEAMAEAYRAMHQVDGIDYSRKNKVKLLERIKKTLRKAVKSRYKMIVELVSGQISGLKEKKVAKEREMNIGKTKIESWTESYNQRKQNYMEMRIQNRLADDVEDDSDSQFDSMQSDDEHDFILETGTLDDYLRDMLEAEGMDPELIDRIRYEEKCKAMAQTIPTPIITGDEKKIGSNEGKNSAMDRLTRRVSQSEAVEPHEAGDEVLIRDDHVMGMVFNDVKSDLLMDIAVQEDPDSYFVVRRCSVKMCLIEVTAHEFIRLLWKDTKKLLAGHRERLQKKKEEKNDMSDERKTVQSLMNLCTEYYDLYSYLWENSDELATLPELDIHSEVSFCLYTWLDAAEIQLRQAKENILTQQIDDQLKDRTLVISLMTIVNILNNSFLKTPHTREHVKYWAEILTTIARQFLMDLQARCFELIEEEDAKYLSKRKAWLEFCQDNTGLYKRRDKWAETCQWDITPQFQGLYFWGFRFVKEDEMNELGWDDQKVPDSEQERKQEIAKKKRESRQKKEESKRHSISRRSSQDSDDDDDDDEGQEDDGDRLGRVWNYILGAVRDEKQAERDQFERKRSQPVYWTRWVERRNKKARKNQDIDSQIEELLQIVLTPQVPDLDPHIPDYLISIFQTQPRLVQHTELLGVFQNGPRLLQTTRNSPEHIRLKKPETEEEHATLDTFEFFQVQNFAIDVVHAIGDKIARKLVQYNWAVFWNKMQTSEFTLAVAVQTWTFLMDSVIEFFSERRDSPGVLNLERYLYYQITIAICSDALNYAAQHVTDSILAATPPEIHNAKRLSEVRTRLQSTHRDCNEFLMLLQSDFYKMCEHEVEHLNDDEARNQQIMLMYARKAIPKSHKWRKEYRFYKRRLKAAINVLSLEPPALAQLIEKMLTDKYTRPDPTSEHRDRLTPAELKAIHTQRANLLSPQDLASLVKDVEELSQTVEDLRIRFEHLHKQRNNRSTFLGFFGGR